MASWPSTLPQVPVGGGFSGGPQPNKISFQPEIGPSIDRRRGTAVGHLREIRLQPIDRQQLATFVQFFEIDLRDGILPFTWIDPQTDEAAQWKFAGSEQPYQIEGLGDDLYNLSFSLMRLP